mmetsp:Transcript_3395/g.7024  ORF Transcript_3395/g.7024 Transcript_3395/m.7024 type:complete len:230 (-) Transcript_3395:161-850(-)
MSPSFQYLSFSACAYIFVSPRAPGAFFVPGDFRPHEFFSGAASVAPPAYLIWPFFLPEIPSPSATFEAVSSSLPGFSASMFFRVQHSGSDVFGDRSLPCDSYPPLEPLLRHLSYAVYYCIHLRPPPFFSSYNRPSRCLPVKFSAVGRPFVFLREELFGRAWRSRVHGPVRRLHRSYISRSFSLRPQRKNAAEEGGDGSNTSEWCRLRHRSHPASSMFFWWPRPRRPGNV